MVMAWSICLLAAMPAFADEPAGEGITVIGNGTVKGKPTLIEVDVNVSGQGELASDARVKYQDAKKKGLAALDALKNPDLSVESEGPAISEPADPQAQMRMMQGMGGAVTAKTKVQISETLKIQIKAVDKLQPDQILETVLKLIDTCHDAGLAVGPAPATNYFQMQMRAQSGAPDALVSFKIPDKAELENRAYGQAVADAKAKAERIAALSGVKLGRVMSVKDQGASAAGPSSPRQAYLEMITGADPGDSDDSDANVATSASPGEIPVSVHLTVTFEIVK